MSALVSPVGRANPLTRLRLIVYASAFAMALVAVLFIAQSQSFVLKPNDSYKFADLGRNLAEGHGFELTGGSPTTRRGPGYPGLIALVYLVFGEHVLAIQICQCALAAGTALLAFEIGRKVFSRRTGLLAAAIVALHPMVLRYVPDIQVEALLTFLYTLTVYNTVCLVERGTVSNGVLVGLSAGAAAMVKAIVLPYAALFALFYLAMRRWQARRAGGGGGVVPGWKPIAGLFIAMAVVILPWTARNYRVTGGHFVLVSRNASGEFLRGYVFAQPKYYLLRELPYTDGENEANAMQQELFRSQGLVWERDEAETERVQNAAMKEKLRADPLAELKKFAIGLFMFWYVVTTPLNSLVIGTLALVGWALALLGWVRARRQGYRFWLLFLPILSLNAIYALVLALGRYSAPCVPLLMVLAAFGVERLVWARTPAPAAD